MKKSSTATETEQLQSVQRMNCRLITGCMRDIAGQRRELDGHEHRLTRIENSLLWSRVLLFSVLLLSVASLVVTLCLLLRQ